jgi:hypothetical protein
MQIKAASILNKGKKHQEQYHTMKATVTLGNIAEIIIKKSSFAHIFILFIQHVFLLSIEKQVRPMEANACMCANISVAPHK